MKLLKYPHPYKAWFTLSNDPDHTTLDRWNKLHQAIWGKLELPFSDSLFVKSYNDYVPGQVNLFDQKHLILGHSYDTIHTWGDYVYSRDKVFTHNDAVEAVDIINEFGIKPLIWVDHSSFTGNFIKNSDWGTKAYHTDAAGHKYKNFVYSLDLAYSLGIRYIWDGYLVETIDQQPNIFRKKHIRGLVFDFFYKHLKGLFSRLFKVDIRRDEDSELNRYGLKIVDFGNGRRMYSFRRFGTWNDAHIDGIPKIVNESMLNKLVKNGGICFLYTHLGKKLAAANHDEHISRETLDTFTLLKKYYEDKLINLSSFSKLLDYIVLKDSINIDMENSRIEFSPDGIRFKDLTCMDLAGQSFSFSISKSISIDGLLVYINGKKSVCHSIIVNTPKILTLSFQ